MSDHDPAPPSGTAATPVHGSAASVLSDDAVASLASSAVDLTRYRNDVGDTGALDVLVEIVAASARANDSISQLKERLIQHGDRVVTVAREIANFL